MNLRFLHTCFILIVYTTYIVAQVGTISTGQGYNKMSFYNFKTETETQINNDAWDIAFSNIGATDAGVFINEAVGSTGAPLQLFLAPTDDWNTPITDNSIFVDSLRLFNKELNWTQGAFNHIADPTSFFDYGWGAYNPQSHIIEGTKVFVIKNRDLTFTKIQIVKLQSKEFTIKYANLDGSNEVTKTISKTNPAYGPTLFFSLKSGEIIATPREYDIIFTRYNTPLDAGNGDTLQYLVTGILLAPGAEGVKVSGLSPDQVVESDYLNQYASDPNTIGHDWKSFDFTQGWIIPEDLTFFVKTKDKDKYKLVFLDFEGSTTGTATFEQTFIGNFSSTYQIAQTNTLTVGPNPSTDFITISDENDVNIKVEIFSVTGQRLLTIQSQTNTNINIQNINYCGPAVLTVSKNGLTEIKKIIIN